MRPYHSIITRPLVTVEFAGVRKRPFCYLVPTAAKAEKGPAPATPFSGVQLLATTATGEPSTGDCLAATLAWSGRSPRLRGRDELPDGRRTGAIRITRRRSLARGEDRFGRHCCLSLSRSRISNGRCPILPSVTSAPFRRRYARRNLAGTASGARYNWLGAGLLSPWT